MAVSPNFTFLVTAARVGLAQGFALLTAAESQSLVCARRSVGGLGRRLSAQRGLDGVEFGSRAAKLRALHHQHRGQEQQAAGRVPAPHPRGHLPAGGEGSRGGAEPGGVRRARGLADAVPQPCLLREPRTPGTTQSQPVARCKRDPSEAGSPAGPGGAVVPGGGHSLGAVLAEEEA